MSEATVVNLFTVVRALLIGGFLMIIPLVTRKGLLFGVYVGEEFADGDHARGLRRSWYRSCVILTLAAMGIGLGISAIGAPKVGNLVCTAGFDLGEDLKVAGQSVMVSGEVGGDAVLAAEEIQIGPGAIIRGDLIWDSETEPEIAASATIEGEIIEEDFAEQFEGVLSVD